MSHYTYEFLSESFLFAPRLIETNYSSVSEKKLKGELVKYREYSINELDSVFEAQESSRLSLMGSKSFSSIGSIKKAALYLDNLVLPDPLFPFSEPRHPMSEAMADYLSLPNNKLLDRVGLAEAIRFIIKLRPLVVGLYVRLCPISYLSERPIKDFPINYSPDQYENSLPSAYFCQAWPPIFA